MEYEEEEKNLSASIGHEFETDEKARSKMAQMRKLQLPEIFVEQSINLDVDEREDTAMAFSDRDDNLLFVSLGDSEGEIDVTINLEFKYRNVFEDLIQKISNVLPEAKLESFSINVMISEDFEDFNLPLEADQEYEIKGVRLSDGDREFAVQEVDEDNVQVIAHFEMGKLKSIGYDSLIKEKDNEMEQFIGDMK